MTAAARVDPAHLDPAQLDLAAFAARLAEALTAAGMPVAPGRAATAAAALPLAPPATRSALYWTTRVTLVDDVSRLATFDQVFTRLFGSAHEAPLDPAEFRGDRPAPPAGATEPGPPNPLAGARRSSTWQPPALVARHLASRAPDGPNGPERTTLLAAVSPDEVLRRRDLAEFDEGELTRLRMLLARLSAEPPLRPGRRTRRSSRGRRVDLRATLRAAVRTGGDPRTLVRRRHRPSRRRLVLLCDVSGSMESYARAYLLLLGSAAVGARAEAFVLATRLTRVTGRLRGARRAGVPADVATAAEDWGGGTRLGETIREFVDGPGRRGVARGAVVVILSDGWEAHDPALLGQQVERLSRLAHRIVWVNPRQAAISYQPLAAGMAAALPYVDHFVSGHSLEALEEVLAVIRRGGTG